MRASEEQWRERVRQWRRSGLSARQFADQLGVSASTLTYWSWRFRRMAPRPQVRRQASGDRSLAGASFVELRTDAAQDQRFELELDGGRRLRIPGDFDAAALKRLLEVLEGGR